MGLLFLGKHGLDFVTVVIPDAILQIIEHLKHGKCLLITPIFVDVELQPLSDA